MHRYLSRSSTIGPTYGERSHSHPPPWVPESRYDAPSKVEEEDYGHTIREIDEECLEGPKLWIN
jgi:hypothetical protein